MLTDTKIKSAQPKDRDYKLGDRDGLYLLVTPKGGKYWRYKYRIAVGDRRVEKKGSLGTYPEVTLAEARTAHGEAVKHLRQGDDPVEVKRRDMTAKAFEREKGRPFAEVAQEWFDDLIVPHCKSHNTLRRYAYNLKVLKTGIRAAIGDVRLTHLTELLLTYERQGKYETRRRIQVDALSIMGMAQTRGYVEINHLAGVSFIKGYVAPGSVHEPRPAVTDADGFGRLLRDIDRGPRRTSAALRLLALTMLRPGELLQGEWSNVDWKAGKLVVPFALLKMRTKRKGKNADGRNLEVPLSRQALAELKALHRETGKGRYILPAQSTGSKVGHMRGYILNRALERLDYAGIHCPHGFRSSASTLLNAERRVIGGEEVLRWPEQKALIELQLDHSDASVQAIYDRGGRWKERCELMQLWADRIDEMRGTTKLRLVA